MKIQIDVSEKCEATRAPYWLIISPRQNFETNERGLHNVASMITGPFFSREEADQIVESQPHRFGSTSYVFCCSGHNTLQYEKATKYLGMERPEQRGELKPRIIGWSAFHILCHFRRDEICMSRFEKAIDDHAGDIPDEEVACSVKNCGIWEGMEEVTT